jgi:hypothetical protein
MDCSESKEHGINATGVSWPAALWKQQQTPLALTIYFYFRHA